MQKIIYAETCERCGRVIWSERSKGFGHGPVCHKRIIREKRPAGVVEQVFLKELEQAFAEEKAVRVVKWKEAWARRKDRLKDTKETSAVISAMEAS